VRAGFIHYLLMILIALTVIVGMPIIGSPLVTALLVLPGVSATLLSQRLRSVIVFAITLALIAAIVGMSPEEESLDLALCAAHREAYALYGQLLTQLGEDEEALSAYRSGLGLLSPAAAQSPPPSSGVATPRRGASRKARG